MIVYDFLRKIPLFMDLPKEDLERLCEMVSELLLPAGQILIEEGSLGDKAYVVKSGQLEILKESGGRHVLLAVRQAGEVIGEMALLESAPRFATVRARTDSNLLVIDHKHLDRLLNTSPSAAKAMLHTITARLRSTEIVLQQSEKMAQLGTMTAGIAHELNNPAAAMGRGAAQLEESIDRLRKTTLQLSKINLTETQQHTLDTLENLARQRASYPADLDPLARSDLQDQLETWLDEHEIDDSWELAPILVELNYDEELLNQLVSVFQSGGLSEVIQWLEATYNSYRLLQEIIQGTSRMSEIIKALKSYVYLDQAPMQTIDIHESLDNTLVMLRSKLKDGIHVQRAYDPDLPHILAFGSELNQVWTNLIDNAVDAMDGKGELIIRTRHEGEWVYVEFQDNGPGIPPDIQPKLFSPFFTTKPMGKGTGLGLNISYNIAKKHGGEITVTSQPGMTCFQVRLPLNFEKSQSESPPVPGFTPIDDEALRQILEQTRKIAVVGISKRPDSPAYSVPKYLQDAGYRIIPINPNLEEILGETAYPDLLAVPEPVDTVLIFRRSEHVPEIAAQAIQVGAAVIWMQEGIINQNAAATGEAAGLKVIMNTCMRSTHRRLIGA
jgi:signal transduction histidine kinase/predicted CoA-binding protein